MKDFSVVKARFNAFLEDRQKNAPLGRDMRNYLESLRYQTIGIGHVNMNLRRAWARNLDAAFPQLIAYDSQIGWRDVTAYFGLGCILENPETSNEGLIKVFRCAPETTSIVLFEIGFLATTQTWQKAFRHPDPTNACLGYVFDDVAQYYMADYPNRLTEKLNSEEELTVEQRDRALHCMDFIAKHYISKYNHQPYIDLGEAKENTRRVLVVDQSFADASVVFGKVSERNFQEMLMAAVRENPEAEIWVKTHPDNHGDYYKRTGYFSGLMGYGNVRILTVPMNPMRLLEQMDKVYVATSGMGVEALLMGKEVVCFGAPFYAGWGITDDRMPVPHRHRQRSLVDIFHYFYIWYTHYHTPESNGPCEIEEVLEYILKYRPAVAGPSVRSRKDMPKISVIIPAYNVERYIRECLDSVLGQTLRDIEVIVAEDCSTDRTLEIVEEIAARDARVRMLRMERNIGQGFARNKALDVARGDYIWFIDSDDFMPESDALERLYEAATRNNADMTRGRKLFERLEDANGLFVKNQYDETEKHFTENRDRMTFEADTELLHSRNFWNWLYRREFLNRNAVRFTTTQWEERPFLLRAQFTAKTISMVNCDATRYRVRHNSTMRRDNKSLRDVEMRVENFEAVVDLFKEFAAREGFEYHKNFITSQYVAFYCNGFVVPMILEAPEAERQRLLDRLAAAFRESGVKVWDLLADSKAVHKERFNKGFYHMLLAALKRGDAKMISMILDGRRLSQAEYYRLLGERYDEEFVYALNLYISAFEQLPPSQKITGWPAKRPEILLHVGASKTGSTFLQAWMDMNRHALLEQGIWYPEFGIFRQDERKYKQAGHADVLGNAARGESTFLDRLAEGLSLFPDKVHRIILSSEAFFLSDMAPTHLRTYLADFDVRVIVYLRRQDDWANSQYCDALGGGIADREFLSVQQWLAAPAQAQRMDYYSFVSKWETEFGRGKVEPVPYEKSQFVDNSLLADFCYRAGVVPGRTFRLPARELGDDYVYPKSYYSLMRFFNALPFPDTKHYLAFVNVVKNTIFFGSSVIKPQMLSRPQRRAILSNYAAGNAIIAAKFLNRKDGRLFLDESIPEITDDDPETIDAVILERMWVIYRCIVGNGRLVFEKAELKRTSHKLSLKQKIVFWLITPVVKKLANTANFQRFKENPGFFFKSLKNQKYRNFGGFFFPS